MNFILIKSLRYEKFKDGSSRSVTTPHEHVVEVINIKDKEEFHSLYPYKPLPDRLMSLVESDNRCLHFIVNLDLYNQEEYSKFLNDYQKMIDIAIEYTRDKKLNTILGD